MNKHMRSLSEYVVEFKAYRGADILADKLDASNLNTESIMDLLENIGYKRCKDIKFTSYTLKDLYKKYSGTDSWISITDAMTGTAWTRYIIVFSSKRPEKLMRFMCEPWPCPGGSILRMSEVIEFSGSKFKSVEIHSNNSGREKKIADMVNRFLGLEK